MKKIFKTMLSLSLVATLGLALVACAKTQKPAQEEKPAEKKMTEEKPAEKKMEAKKKVVATTSFVADMIKVIAGDTFDVYTVVKPGGDPHIYEPTTEDKTALEKADLVLYHGLHFEGKMTEILEKLGKNLSQNFPKEKIGTFEEDGQTVQDPHFWFDIDLYGLAVQEAAKHLSDLQPDKKEEFKKNLEAYLAELKKLDEENKKALDAIPEGSRYLVTPHDAFNYFAKRYNLTVHAPQGVSTESEASVKDVTETVDFIVKHRIKAIFVESTTNPDNMKKLQEAAKAKGWEVKVVSGEGKELLSDSLAEAGQEGDNYLDMYRHNVKLISENLK